MYHDLSDSKQDCDGLTVWTTDFIEQMQYLKTAGYTFLNLSELIGLHKQNKKLEPKTVLITFDDGYLRSCEILKNCMQTQLLDLKINMFLPMGYLGHINHWDHGNKKIISAEQMQDYQNLNSKWNWGFHSYKHTNYSQLNFSEIESDLKFCFQIKKDLEDKYGVTNITSTLAYPFGAFWRKQNSEFFSTLKKVGIELAFRIGNRRNLWPLKNPLLIQRMDIRGDRDFNYFKKQCK